ncbi:Urease accessory protein UreE [Nitrospira japonica]|uniref:Urease accessory protein UreE n=1 Tax=Nitrospira japonica TaxID=1325564 RepID=A0A1W1I6G7_9BACT|nr:urease accessory protein UreE [Nitrospira japonica]SLM48565.1 Urease accessory protein UreE [Nitrospira japonica]
MLVIEAIIGNIHESAWSARLQHATLDWLALDQWEAQKSRLRKLSQNGVDVAISLPRGILLRDGDVLMWEESRQAAIVARVSLKDVMVVELTALQTHASDILIRTCVELGHALGNQHWPAVVKGDRIYVPLTVDQKVMASVMKTHAFRGITYHFVPGSEVIPYLAPHESRRLFGGAEGPVHSHEDGHDHSHDHAHPHGHGHPHDHAH